MRISLSEAVGLFKEWKDHGTLINVTLGLNDKPVTFDAPICAVSRFGRLMFLVPSERRRRVINLRDADVRRLDVAKTSWEVYLVAFLKRGPVTRGFVLLAKRG